MQSTSRCSPAMFTLAAALVVGSIPVSAFGTITKLGQNAEHERITRAALAQLGKDTLNELAGKNGAFGAVGAPDNPLRGLMGTEAAHCDGGDHLDPTNTSGKTYPQSRADADARLTACRTFVMTALNKAVELAGPLASPGRYNTSLGCVFDGSKGRAKCNVLEQMGLAFHASQDFYSHSNWTDMAAAGKLSPQNPPGLRNSNRAPWLDPRLKLNVPQGLITGCFGIPEESSCTADGQQRVMHKVLNKDNGQIRAGLGTQSATPRGKISGNFGRAVKAAIEDTQDKWKFFKERVLETYGGEKGRKIICAIEKDNYRQCG